MIPLSNEIISTQLDYPDNAVTFQGDYQHKRGSIMRPHAILSCLECLVCEACFVVAADPSLVVVLLTR